MLARVPRIRLLVTIAVLGAASLGVACGDGDDGAADRPAARKLPPPVVVPKNQVKNPKPMRDDLRKSVELPDYYPEDAPIYPKAMTNNAGWASGRVTAVFSTEDEAPLVTAYIHAKLAELGWRKPIVEEMPNGTVTHAFKAGREVKVLISQMDENTEYELTMIVVAVDPQPQP